MIWIELIRLEAEEWDDCDEVEWESHEGGIKSSNWIQECTRNKHAKKTPVRITKYSNWTFKFLKIFFEILLPGKRPEAHGDPEVELIVRDKMEEGGEDGAQQRAIEGVDPAVHHRGGVQTQHVVCQGGDEALKTSFCRRW